MYASARERAFTSNKADLNTDDMNPESLACDVQLSRKTSSKTHKPLGVSAFAQAQQDTMVTVWKISARVSVLLIGKSCKVHVRHRAPD